MPEAPRRRRVVRAYVVRRSQGAEAPATRGMSRAIPGGVAGGLDVVRELKEVQRGLNRLSRQVRQSAFDAPSVAERDELLRQADELSAQATEVGVRVVSAAGATVEACQTAFEAARQDAEEAIAKFEKAERIIGIVAKVIETAAKLLAKLA